jgi:enoyl-CoA hydratase
MDFVKYTVDGAVALIELNRPPVNALSGAVARELTEATAMAEDPAIRAVVITGSPHFAAGADISGFQGAHGEGAGGLEGNRLDLVVRRFEQLAKPTIAAIHGYALGGGLELAMGADFRYMAEDAQVGQPEIKLGIIPGAGGTQRLTRLVGLSKARQMNYSGDFVGAEEAVAIGLAEKVFPVDELLPKALADAAVWATKATLAIGAAKRAMNDGLGRPIDEALAIEAERFAEVFPTEDAKEGVAAFLGKREAKFEGR